MFRIPIASFILVQTPDIDQHQKHTLRAGFEPARGDPIGFQVQRLNHSAITACALKTAYYS